MVAPPALVFHDLFQPEKLNARRVRMHLDLEATFLAGCDRRSVPESKRLQTLAEGDDFAREGTAEIRGMATGMKAPKIAIELALRRPNGSLIPNHQRSIHGRHRVPASGFRLDPAQDLVCGFQAGYVARQQLTAIEADRRQTRRLSIPAQIHSDEGIHHRATNSTASPTEIRPGETT